MNCGIVSKLSHVRRDRYELRYCLEAITCEEG